jgi:hypothetical protein
VADRPIIFSGPMVRALLAGRKTQTRRLATSPLRRCEIGDRLYVRESWKPHSTFAGWKPRDIPQSNVFYTADGTYAPSNTPWVPSIHMPRWASRLTLIVEGVKVEPLQAISEADAVAEGIRPLQGSDGPYYHTVDIDGGSLNEATAALTYKLLWNVLHGEESWDANPDVLALTFRVERGNIDRLAA